MEEAEDGKQQALGGGGFNSYGEGSMASKVQPEKGEETPMPAVAS